MLIDWFTVGAQALNFLVLVWLMRRFLYQPVLTAIDAREKRIAAQIADAETKKTEAQKERDEFRNKNEAFDQQRAALVGKATDEAKVEQQRLMDNARKTADEMSTKRAKTLHDEATTLSQAITRQAQDEVFSIARKTLSDLATISLETQMTEVFTQQLRSMDEHAKADFGQALKAASEPALIRSAFALTAEQSAAIQTALNEIFSAKAPLRFETAPELIGGIELSTTGQKISWSIAEYLKSVERSVGKLVAVA